MTFRLPLAAATLLAALALSAPAFAQAAMHGPQHGAPAAAAAPAADTPATQAFKQANDKMHRDMAIRFTGDADRDFVAGMIAHHQGAIDMARVLLQYGKDAQIRKMAEGIIAAQEGEIADMKAWQARQR